MLPISTIGGPRAAAAGAAERLARDFAVFTAAAAGLEEAYGRLQNEVGRLRQQLEAKEIELVQEQDRTRHWRALAEVARLLAHELRNPLASLELFAGLLAGSHGIGTEERRVIGSLQAGIRYLTATLNNIVHYHERPGGATAETDLGALVGQTCAFLAPLAAQASVRLRFRDGLQGARVKGDPHRLQQVLLNLGLNALRAMEGGGRLSLGGRTRPGGSLQLWCRDTGPGVIPELRASLFAAGVSGRADGLGLGLAVARTIIGQHGGSIRLLETRRGAAFLITLPKAGKPRR